MPYQTRSVQVNWLKNFPADANTFEVYINQNKIG